MPSPHVKVSGVWKKVNKTYVKVAGVWKQVLNSYVKVGGEWKKTSSSGGSLFIFDQTISADTNNYNLKNAAIAAGWNETDPLQASVTINSGVVVSSVLSTGIAFDTGSGFPDGTTLSLTNNGTIRGKGGNGGVGGQSAPAGNGEAGGTALRTQYLLSVTNNGAIEGGGGGGGGGESIYCIWNQFGYWGVSGGGGGVGGAGFGLGAVGGLTSGGTDPFRATTNSWHGATGTSGTATAAGTPYNATTPIGSRGGRCDMRGNDSAYNSNGGHGGIGGALGQAGQNGGVAEMRSGNSSPIYYGYGVGGAGGAAVQGNSAITWITTGTRTGSINA